MFNFVHRWGQWRCFDWTNGSDDTTHFPNDGHPPNVHQSHQKSREQCYFHRSILVRALQRAWPVESPIERRTLRFVPFREIRGQDSQRWCQIWIDSSKSIDKNHQRRVGWFNSIVNESYRSSGLTKTIWEFQTRNNTFFGTIELDVCKVMQELLVYGAFFFKHSLFGTNTNEHKLTPISFHVCVFQVGKRPCCIRQPV